MFIVAMWTARVLGLRLNVCVATKGHNMAPLSHF